MHTLTPLDVLIVADWPQTREMLLSIVRRGGWEVEAADDGAAALRTVRARRPGVVVVEGRMAAASDWRFVTELRQTGSEAVLMAVVAGDPHTRITALNRGADDVLSMPIDAAEVIARVAANLRMLRRVAGWTAQEPEIHDDGVFRIDVAARRVTIAGRPVELTPLEFRLMVTLVRNAHRVVGRDEIEELTWYGSRDSGNDQVKLYVHYLRRKLGAAGATNPIQTVRGFGYRWLGARSTERAG